MLDRVARTFYTVASADGTLAIQAVEEELAPLMSAHRDAIQLDADLFARIAAVHAQLDSLGLDAESRYLVERYHREMSLAGAGLDDAQKQKLTELNQRLSVLTTTFEKNLLADTNGLAVVFDSADELDGLSDGELSAAAQAATSRGLDGRYVVNLTLYTGHPLLASLTNRESRRRLLEASRSRATRGNDNDNRAVLREIVRLRAERAAVLGYPSHAAAVLADQTAGSPDAARDLLRRLATPAAANTGPSKRLCRRSPRPMASGSKPTTGRSTPRRSAPSATTSTAQPCVRGSRQSGCCATACSSRPRSSTASA